MPGNAGGNLVVAGRGGGTADHSRRGSRRGRAQRAYIPVADGNNLYTVVVAPFTGRSRVVVGAVEVKE